MFNIVHNKKIFFTIPIIIIVIGIVSMFIQGFNLDIDFRGGTTINAALGKDFDNQEVSDAIKDVLGYAPSSVQKSGDDGTDVVIKVMHKSGQQELDTTQRGELTQALIDKCGIEEAAISISNVSATIGKELTSQSLLLCIITIALMLIYITIRFEVRSGLAAVLALTHDVLIMLTCYSLFRIPVNTSFIAAILTILGYSINATIIVFDRIREGMRGATKKTVISDVVEKSIWSTIGRSINTSVTTLLTIVLLFFIGVPSLKEFTLPLIIGIICGTYSSIFIAGPFWSMWKENSAKARKVATK